MLVCLSFLYSMDLMASGFLAGVIYEWLITTREFGHTSLQVKLSSEYDSWNFSFLSSQDLISELHSRFPTKDYRQISLIFIRKITGFYRFRLSHSVFYRFQLFSFRVLQISAFLIPGITDSGFPHSGFYRFWKVCTENDFDKSGTMEKVGQISFRGTFRLN
jgi:hypothetical protein